MRKVSGLMNGYFQRKLLTEEFNIETKGLPVKKRKGSVGWEKKEDPPRFYRKIKFTDHDAFINFVVALLQYEDKVKHNAKIIIGYPEIVIQVWTHGLEDITDLDTKYVQEVNYLLDELA